MKFDPKTLIKCENPIKGEWYLFSNDKKIFTFGQFAYCEGLYYLLGDDDLYVCCYELPQPSTEADEFAKFLDSRIDKMNSYHNIYTAFNYPGLLKAFRDQYSTVPEFIIPAGTKAEQIEMLSKKLEELKK